MKVDELILKVGDRQRSAWREQEEMEEAEEEANMAEMAEEGEPERGRLRYRNLDG